jgi:hypothetical protein
MTLRATDCHLTSPEYLNMMLLAYMLACALCDKIGIAIGANDIPISG